MKKIFSSRIIISALLVALSTMITVVVVRATKEQSNLKRLQIENKTVIPAFKNDSTKKMKNLVVKNDLQKYGIEVIASTDANFDGELGQYIGNEDSLVSLVESTKPFALFISNNSTKDIVGVSLRWKFSLSDGRNVEIPQSEANPGVLMGMKTLDPNLVGKTNLINSRAMKFFTYFNQMIGHEINFANMRVKNPSINYNYRVDPNPLAISVMNSQKEEILSNYADFSVSIDGIIFDDGMFVGPDQNFFFDTLRGAIQARKDILTFLIEAKYASKNDTEIVDDILSKTSNMYVNFAPLHTGNPTREQVFDSSYKTYLKNLREEFVMQRSRFSDEKIVKIHQSVQGSDFVTLRKER